MILSTRDGWAELYNVREDRTESIDLAEQMPDLLETLRQHHTAWQEELPAKPLWPRLVDHRFEFNGKIYRFPS
jgi:hypothetical protein